MFFVVWEKSTMGSVTSGHWVVFAMKWPVVNENSTEQIYQLSLLNLWKNSSRPSKQHFTNHLEFWSETFFSEICNIDHRHLSYYLCLFRNWIKMLSDNRSKRASGLWLTSDTERSNDGFQKSGAHNRYPDSANVRSLVFKLNLQTMRIEPVSFPFELKSNRNNNLESPYTQARNYC